MSIERSKVTGIVGHSGAGKSMLLKSIYGLVGRVVKTEVSGQIMYNAEEKGINLVQSDSRTINALRRNKLGYIFQQSAQMFNPSLRIGAQIAERLKLNGENDGKQKVMAMLEELDLTPAERFYNAYPHQLSGGQLQRCLIAMAYITEPELVLADEPTSNLDKAVQEEVIQFLLKVNKKYESTLILVSHDMPLMKEVCDVTYYIKEGRLIEDGYQDTSYVNTQNGQEEENSSVLFEIKGLSKSYPKKRALWSKKVEDLPVLANVNLKVYEGEIVGLYGPSGSGKSTLGRIIACLESYDDGNYTFNGNDVTGLDKDGLKSFRKDCQIIFQDPLSAFAPHRTIRQHLTDRLQAFRINMSEAEITKCMEDVALDSEYLDRLPSTLSAGQLQRACIARALIIRPKLLICDEVISSLDIATGNNILETLTSLNAEYGLSMLFISHNQEVIDKISHRSIDISTWNRESV